MGSTNNSFYLFKEFCILGTTCNLFSDQILPAKISIHNKLTINNCQLCYIAYLKQTSNNYVSLVMFDI